MGRPFAQGQDSKSCWDLVWKDSCDEDFDSNTIVHEIGHALGLSFPFDDPKNENWNTGDTFMSCNESPDSWDVWFGDYDIATLTHIWVVENDDGRGFEGTSLDNYLKGMIGQEIVAGLAGDDGLRGGQGGDALFGCFGADLVHGGNGRDCIWGGIGADKVYRGFGHNTFSDERDGSVDALF